MKVEVLQLTPLKVTVEFEKEANGADEDEPVAFISAVLDFGFADVIEGAMRLGLEMYRNGVVLAQQEGVAKRAANA